MAWIVLVASGVLETVWATALEGSRSFTRPLPSAVFVVALVLSMGGLGYALRTLPVGTAYAVWVATGAVLTTVWAIVTRKERATIAKLALIFGLIVCVAGLQIVSEG